MNLNVPRLERRPSVFSKCFLLNFLGIKKLNQKRENVIKEIGE